MSMTDEESKVKTDDYTEPSGYDKHNQSLLATGDVSYVAENELDLMFRDINELSSDMLHSISPKHITSLNLHANELSRLDASFLASFVNLRRLNLSSNLIVQTNGVECLTKLTELDLSANAIKEVNDLAPLIRLRYLRLSFNCISSLDWLATFQRDNPVLRELELHDNLIANRKEFKHIQHLTSLHSITFQIDNEHSNPVCKLTRYKNSLLEHIPQSVKTIDGMLKEEFQNKKEQIQKTQVEQPTVAVPAPESIPVLHSDRSAFSPHKLSHVHTIQPETHNDFHGTPTIDAVLGRFKDRKERAKVEESTLTAEDVRKLIAEARLSELEEQNIHETRVDKKKNEIAEPICAHNTLSICCVCPYIAVLPGSEEEGCQEDGSTVIVDIPLSFMAPAPQTPESTAVRAFVSSWLANRKIKGNMRKTLEMISRLVPASTSTSKVITAPDSPLRVSTPVIPKVVSSKPEDLVQIEQLKLNVQTLEEKLVETTKAIAVEKEKVRLFKKKQADAVEYRLQMMEKINALESKNAVQEEKLSSLKTVNVRQSEDIQAAHDELRLHRESNTALQSKLQNVLLENVVLQTKQIHLTERIGHMGSLETELVALKKENADQKQRIVSLEEKQGSLLQQLATKDLMLQQSISASEKHEEIKLHLEEQVRLFQENSQILEKQNNEVRSKHWKEAKEWELGETEHRQKYETLQSENQKLLQRVDILKNEYKEKVCSMTDMRELLKAAVNRVRTASKEQQQALLTIETLSSQNSKLSLEAEEREKINQKMTHELNILQEQHQGCDSLTKRLSSEIKILKENIAARERKYRDSDTEVSNLYEEIEMLHRELDEKSEQIQIKDVMLNDQNDTIVSLKQTHGEDEETLQELSKREEMYVAQIEELEESYKDLMRKLEDMEHSEDADRLRQERNEALDNLTECKDELASVKTQLEKKTKMVEYVEIEVEAMRSEFKQREEGILAEHAKKIARLEADIQGHQEEKDMSAKLYSVLENKYAHLVDTLENQMSVIEAKEHELTKSKDKICEVEEEMRELLEEIARRKQIANKLSLALNSLST